MHRSRFAAGECVFGGEFAWPKGHEHLTHAIYYTEIHLIFCSIVWLAAWALTSIPGASAATKHCDPMAASLILNDVEFNDGITRARQQLLEARKRDPKAQLWPEISMSIVAHDFAREHDAKTAIEAFKLNELAYPDSADVADNLADAYLADGQKDLARQYARKSIELLNRPGVPASTWANTEQYRSEIRSDAEKLLQTNQ